jgi:ribosome recycling factor
MNTSSHNGYFFPPYIYEIQKISQLKQEVFGPILHIIRFNKSQLNEVISDINDTGYGLTFSLQSRIQILYFSISTITGKRSLSALMDLKKEMEYNKLLLKNISFERKKLSNKVFGLYEKSLDLGSYW